MNTTNKHTESERHDTAVAAAVAGRCVGAAQWRCSERTHSSTNARECITVATADREVEFELKRWEGGFSKTTGCREGGGWVGSMTSRHDLLHARHQRDGWPRWLWGL